MTGRILIVSSAHLCRNPRVWKEAVTLGRAGHDVTVLTVLSHPPSVPLDRELAATAPFRLATIDHLAARSLPRWRALRDRLQTRVARRFVARTGLQLPSALGPARRLLLTARRYPADLTIVHCEAPAWVGLKLLQDGRRVAADFEDWYSEDLLPADRRHRPIALLRRIERQLIQRATYVTTTSAAMADGLQGRYGGPRPAVIRNVFPLPPPPPPRPPGRPAVFVWMSQTVGPGRGLESFFDTWANLPVATDLRLIGQAAPAYQEALLDRLPATRRSAVHFQPFVSPAALPAELATADIGLALEADEPPSRRLTITNKIFQYLGSGLAVLATPTAGQREVFDLAPGIGWLEGFTEPSRSAARLAELLADRQRLRLTQAAARAAAEARFSWEREAPRLLGLVERVIRP